MKTHQGMEIRATSVTGATSATAGFGHPVTKTQIARAIEWPTLALALGLDGAWLVLTLGYSALPLWLLVPLGSWVTAWHASLQHEAIHGHPTRNVRLNALIAGVPLLLWLPYGVFRSDHLAHHDDQSLTDPFDDPGSFYVARTDWARMRLARRGLLTALNSLTGRLILGPPAFIALFWWREAWRLIRGDLVHLGDWLLHAGMVSLVVYWLSAVVGMPISLYVVCFVYPGTALILLHSFIEHRPDARVSRRTAIVEAGPLLSLLYLNNNLHALHHARPDIAWYKLPAVYRDWRRDLLARNDGFRFSGYDEITRRFLLRAKDSPRHPLVD